MDFRSIRLSNNEQFHYSRLSNWLSSKRKNERVITSGKDVFDIERALKILAETLELADFLELLTWPTAVLKNYVEAECKLRQSNDCITLKSEVAFIYLTGDNTRQPSNETEWLLADGLKI